MSIVENKSKILKIKRSTQKDISNIIDFHKRNIQFEMPQYLNNTLLGNTGISLVAYQKDIVLGHLLILPLFSVGNSNLEEAAIICGIWTNNNDITKKLIKEANMTAWESGYHVLFSLERNKTLKEAGFKPISQNYFSFDTSKFCPMAMELSWNGYAKISKRQCLPSIFIPQKSLTSQFSKN